MTAGEWLSHHGVPYLVTTPGGSGERRPLPGLPIVTAPDGEVALLLAEAEATTGAGVGALWDGEVLTVLSRRVDPGEPATVSSAAELAAALEDARKAGAGALSVRPDFDLTDAPGQEATRPAGFDPSLAPRAVGTPWTPGTELVADLVLAGRGVVRAGMVPALQEFADASGLGVLNAFTAKGVFRWDSPYHLGTGCLQEMDLLLAAGRTGAVVVTVGLDADEAPAALFGAAGLDPAEVVTLEPADLPQAARVVRARSRVTAESPRPPLYRDLAAVAQPLYTQTGAPLNPACAAAGLAAALPATSAVHAEAGPAGHWLGRTFSTVRLGSVKVPPTAGTGLALAAAVAARLRGEGAAIAVVDQDPSGAGARCLDWARQEGLGLVVEVWAADGELLDADAHRARLAARLAEPGVHVTRTGVDYAASPALLAAAGPLVAWGA